jgi:hypothetical protein
LRSVAPDPRLWDGKYDVSHTGTIDIKPMSPAEQSAFWERYQALPSIFASRA